MHEATSKTVAGHGPARPVSEIADEIETSLTALSAKRNEWAALDLGEKIRLLGGIAPRIDRVAANWVSAAVLAKGIDPSSPLVGEEWISGPWAVLAGVNALQGTLDRVHRGQPPIAPSSFRTLKSGRVVADAYPTHIFETLLMNGYKAEVWMEPGATVDEARAATAGFYAREAPEGRLCVVLGAGNIASIPALDLIYKLYAEGAVCAVKLNPVNEYLGTYFAEVFAEFVERGYVRFVRGGADVGRVLVESDLVDEIHITGSGATHDAIVFGAGPEGAERKARNEPLLQKRITSELGGVTPTIVVPGPWTDADVSFQAENIATQKLHNAGHNCVAAQVLVLSDSWSQGNSLVDEVREVVRRQSREPYYPGTADRQRKVREAHGQAENLGGRVPKLLVPDVAPEDESAHCFRSEVFAGTLATTRISGEGPAEFLRNAVAFVNDKLEGTLGVNLIIHHQTAREHADALERAITDLRYGAIAVNAWCGVNFLLPQCTWGAFPEHTLDDVQSGIGVVHNSFLFDRAEKTVVRAPFRPFPRTLFGGGFHLSPKPPWFVTNRTAHTTGRRLTRFAAKPGWLRLPAIFASALRG